MLTTILRPTSGRALVLGVDCAKDPEHVRHIDELTVEVKLETGPKGVTDIVRALDAAELTPACLIVREPTLAMIGLSTRNPEAAQAAAFPIMARWCSHRPPSCRSAASPDGCKCSAPTSRSR